MVSLIFTVIVVAAPSAFFVPKGQPMVNVALITLFFYNTLLGFWIKQEISAQAARILLAIQESTALTSKTLRG